MCLENLVSNSFLFNVVFKHYILPNKSSLLSGNRPGKSSLITHPPAKSNVYQNIYFSFYITNKQAKIKTKTKTKKQKKITKKNYKAAIHEKNILDKLFTN